MLLCILSPMNIAPQAASIMLILNSSFVQIGFALGSGLGGVVVNLADIHSIIWVSLLSVCVATIIGLFSFKQPSKVTKEKQQQAPLRS